MFYITTTILIEIPNNSISLRLPLYFAAFRSPQDSALPYCSYRSPPDSEIFCITTTTLVLLSLPPVLTEILPCSASTTTIVELPTYSNSPSLILLFITPRSSLPHLHFPSIISVLANLAPVSLSPLIFCTRHYCATHPCFSRLLLFTNCCFLKTFL